MDFLSNPGQILLLVSIQWLVNLLKHEKPKHNPSNINLNKVVVFKNLKKDRNIIITKADKGMEVVILNKHV